MGVGDKQMPRPNFNLFLESATKHMQRYRNDTTFQENTGKDHAFVLKSLAA